MVSSSRATGPCPSQTFHLFFHLLPVVIFAPVLISRNFSSGLAANSRIFTETLFIIQRSCQSSLVDYAQDNATATGSCRESSRGNLLSSRLWELSKLPLDDEI